MKSKLVWVKKTLFCQHLICSGKPSFLGGGGSGRCSKSLLGRQPDPPPKHRGGVGWRGPLCISPVLAALLHHLHYPSCPPHTCPSAGWGSVPVLGWWHLCRSHDAAARVQRSRWVSVVQNNEVLKTEWLRTNATSSPPRCLPSPLKTLARVPWR